MTPLLRKPNDDRAFERLYQRHVKSVYRYALAVLGVPADAEDVTQTTFLNAYRAFQRGERPQKPENWLIVIAQNVCRQRFRQQQARPAEVELADEFDSALERDEEGPTLAELRRAFAALPPNQRAALVMRELEGRPYTEIAQTLGLTVSALESLLFRARRALREQLEEQLSCREAAFALSRQLDGRLSAGERRALRTHLRGCSECAQLASSQRAQRKKLRTLLAVPLPDSLHSFWPHAAQTVAAGSTAAAGGAAASGSALAVKAAAVVAASTLVGGGTYAGIAQLPPLLEHHAAAAPQSAAKPAAARRHPLVRAAAQQTPTRRTGSTPLRAAKHARAHPAPPKAPRSGRATAVVAPPAAAPDEPGTPPRTPSSKTNHTHPQLPQPRTHQQPATTHAQPQAKERKHTPPAKSTSTPHPATTRPVASKRPQIPPEHRTLHSHAQTTAKQPPHASTARPPTRPTKSKTTLPNLITSTPRRRNNSVAEAPAAETRPQDSQPSPGRKNRDCSDSFSPHPANQSVPLRSACARVAILFGRPGTG